MVGKINPIIKKFIPLVEGMAATFGSHCEVLLHDFSDLERSIVAIANGHVTGRDINSTMPQMSYDMVVKGNTDRDIINYTGKSKDGRVIKSSTMFIRDESGNASGCFCKNMDITELMSARSVMDEMLKIENDLVISKDDTIDENKINKVLSEMVEQAIAKVGKPVVYLNKDEKVNVVEILDKQGAFLIKGAVEYVAESLCVSRYTIYNYLEEIR